MSNNLESLLSAERLDIKRVKLEIDKIIQDNNIVVFVKGTKDNPQCGFSNRVIQILNNISDDFVVIDILKNFDFKEYMKEYSQWPTFPQVYIRGELVGGCDLVTQEYLSGNLANLINQKS